MSCSNRKYCSRRHVEIAAEKLLHKIVIFKNYKSEQYADLPE